MEEDFFGIDNLIIFRIFDTLHTSQGGDGNLAT